MKKDEMKNRISMALKDPILQQGFELICKDLKELEKENERLTVSYETLKLHDEEEIGMLKSENAELKEALKGKRCNCMTYLNFKDLEKECSKAKELLAKWVELYKPKSETALPTPIQVDTEQFLKGEADESKN